MTSMKQNNDIVQAPYEEAAKEISEAIAKAMEKSGYRYDASDATIGMSKSFGDVSSSIAFYLAKAYKKTPMDIAAQVKGAMKVPECVSEVTTENAYLNFHLDRAGFSRKVVSSALSSSDIVSVMGNHIKVTVEAPSINPNKPWHVGSLRNAILGDVISNLYRACGYDVERENYIDDLGLQVAESLWGFMHLGNTPEGKFDYWLGEQYVKVNKAIEDNANVKAEVAQVLALMEQDGTYEAKLSRELAAKCVAAQYETSFSYHIYHDLLVWEGDIIRERLMDKALAALERLNVIEKPKEGKYAGCVVMNLNTIKDLPPALAGLREDVRVLMRSDGTPTYLAKDIAHHMWKLGILANTFKYSEFMVKRPDGKPIYTTSPEGAPMPFGNSRIAINIIGSAQALPQMILAYAFKMIGAERAENSIVHMSYGEVDVEGGLSGRKGTWLAGYTADNLLKEAISKAQSAMGSRFKLSTEEVERIAKSVAVASIKFEYLRFSPEKRFQFTWERALNFEGASGPYCQYMHARAVRMLEDGGFDERLEPNADFSTAISDYEFVLVKQMSFMNSIIEKACRELRPNAVAEYASDLASTFSKFYENVPVLKAKDEKQRNARLALTSAFARTMARALGILGIDALHKM